MADKVAPMGTSNSDFRSMGLSVVDDKSEYAQKVELITKSNRKDDRHDARILARLARIDPQLLGPVRHRSAKAQST